MALRLDDFSFNTIVGNGSAVNGDMHVNGSVRIDGDVDGNIETDCNIQIGNGARVRGDISAVSATVAGIVLGSIIVKENVSLLAHSVVVGDVIARHVQIEDNVIFHGKCISISDEEQFSQISSRHLEEQAIKVKANSI